MHSHSLGAIETFHLKHPLYALYRWHHSSYAVMVMVSRMFSSIRGLPGRGVGTKSLHRGRDGANDVLPPTPPTNGFYKRWLQHLRGYHMGWAA